MNASPFLDKRITIEGIGRFVLKMLLLCYFTSVDALPIYVGKEGSRLSGIIMIMLLVSILFTLIFVYGRSISIEVSMYHGYLAIFILYCLINSINSDHSATAMSRTFQIARYGLATFVFYIAYDHKESIDDFLCMIMQSGFILMTLYVANYGFDYVVDTIQTGERVTSELINANTLGMTCAYSVLIFLHYWIEGRFKALWSPFAVISIVIILASQSRKAIFILVLGAILSYVFRKRSEPITIRSIAVVVLSIAILVFILRRLNYSGAMDRITGLFNVFKDGAEIDKSTQLRRTFVQIGRDLFHQNPVFGIGIDCARFYTSHLYGYQYHLHNNYIELLADGGIIGLVTYYWLYFFIAIKMIRNLTNESPQLRICLIILLIRLVSDYGYYAYKEQSTYFFLLLFYLCYKYYASNANARRVSNDPLAR